MSPHDESSVPRSSRQPPVPRLSDCPLDERSVRAVDVRRGTTTPPVPHGASVETWSPVLADGGTPAASIVLPHPPEPAGGPGADPARPPRVRFEWDGQTMRAQVAWPEGTNAYGLGERAGRLLRDAQLHALWNTDAYRYDERTPALYQSHPWVLALRPGGAVVGILADTPRRGQIHVAPDGVELAFEGEPFAVHLIDGATPRDVLGALAAMIGTMPLPPLWALGYHQCRYSYESAEEVLEVARRLRAERVPCDAVWLDIDAMDRHRVFTWDAERFPDPLRLTDELEDEGLRTVAILDPGVAVAEDYGVCEGGLAGRHFVEDARGEPVRGRVWPGLCHFPDFTRGSTRAWWGGQVKAYLEESGLAGLWIDMNEPSVFRTPTRTLAEDAVHRGLGGGPHARFHNLYGQLMAEATVAGFRAAYPDRRPFVLTRSSHLAGARFAATWTGDNVARWEDLRWAIPMVLNLGLSGQPFAGADLGGFAGDPSPELFVRWFELGAYLPFCRGHAEKGSARKEPWSFGPDALAHVRAALERRMRLLPTLYTLFEEASRTGLPICRPLWFADPADPRLRAVDDAFLLGGDLLVAPVVEPGAATKRVQLPHNPGGWYAFPAGGVALEDGEVELDAPLGATPALARAGAVIVEAAARRHTGDPDVLRVWHAFLDPEGRAAGRMYEDAGEGYGAPFLAREIEIALRGDVLHVELDESGDGASPEQRRIVRLYGAPGHPRGLELELPLERRVVTTLIQRAG